MTLSPLINAYDAVLLDLDGCVWVGSSPTRGAPEAIAALRAAGKALAFVTNDSRHSPEEYVRKLWSLGIQASLDEVVTVGGAIQHVLAERPPGRPAYVIGSPAIYRHVTDAGHRIVNGTPRAAAAEVVVFASHDDLHFAEMRGAVQAVLAGAELIATDRDGSYPSADGMAPGTGAFLAALEYATGATGRVVGKPEPQLFHTALDRLAPGRALVIGDRLESDLAGAAAAGLDAAIVLTGVTSRAAAEAAADPAPVAIAEDLHALLLGS
jgi:HAD superfamily hydrolase (TIGR01450 family)